MVRAARRGGVHAAFVLLIVNLFSAWRQRALNGHFRRFRAVQQLHQRKGRWGVRAVLAGLVGSKVPLGWTISPALLQLGPAVLAYLAQVRLPRRPAAQVDFGGS